MLLATTRGVASAIAVTSLTTLMLGLAACSEDLPPEPDQHQAALPPEAPSSPAQLVLASYQDLQGEAHTMEVTMTIDGLPFVEGTNRVDGEATHSTQMLRMSALLEAVGGELTDDPELAELVEQMFGDVHTESVLVDGVLYMQLSGSMISGVAEQFGEDAWFTVDLAEHADLREIYAEVGAFDLVSQTQTLLNELTDVRQTGEDVYTGTLSGDSDFMHAIGSTVNESDMAAFEATEVVITLDDDGRLKSMEMNFPEIRGVTMHMVSTVVDVGGSYDITAPAAENTHPLEALIDAMR